MGLFKKTVSVVRNFNVNQTFQSNLTGFATHGEKEELWVLCFPEKTPIGIQKENQPATLKIPYFSQRDLTRHLNVRAR